MLEINKGKNNGLKIGSFLIITFLLIYIPSLFNWVFGRSIQTEIIRMGTLEDSINVDAFIVRDEEVLKSPFQGRCITSVAEGEKVPVNFKVATILNDSSVKMLDDLKKLDLEIIKEQKEKSQNNDFFSEDVSKLEDELKQKISLLIIESNSNSLLGIKQLKADINGLVRKKASIIGSTGTSDARIVSLKSDRDRLQLKIDSNTRTVTSTSSGIVSYMIDGYESSLTPEIIKELTPERLNDIKPGAKKISSGDRIVEADKPFAKIIKDIDCFVIMSLPSKEAMRFKVDDSIMVRINNINKVVNGIVDFKSDEENGKYLLSVKFDQGVSESVGLRKVNTDLTVSSFNGLRVPLTSLRKVDLKEMKAEIVIVKGNYASIRGVRIEGKDEEFAIIKSLDDSDKNTVSLYDTYAVKPGNIQEGQMINQ